MSAVVRTLLAGPPAVAGMEEHAGHTERLGSRPVGGADLISVLERSGLRGRGGAAFPVAAKWRSVARRHHSRAVVVVNGAEGEPLSAKDRVLMTARPHLILDGALLAAEAVGARRILVYVAGSHGAAAVAMRRAALQRPGRRHPRIEVVVAPPGYVSGEETATVHFINDGVALPTTGARPYERGVGGHATLVHNVETLAQVALIARHGDAWFRELGRGSSAGSLLLTLTGAVARPGVIEVPHGVPLAEVIGVRGPDGREPQAVLLGGYVGGWVAGAGIEALSLDAAELRGGGRSLGCGVVSVLPHGHCGVAETARILTYLAGQSARQCGPCVFGLAAIAAATTRLSWCAPQADDLSRIRRWSEQLGGRGACKHPDGAAAMLLSALGVFEQEFRYHQEFRSCPASGMERYAS